MTQNINITINKQKINMLIAPSTFNMLVRSTEFKITPANMPVINVIGGDMMRATYDADADGVIDTCKFIDCGEFL